MLHYVRSTLILSLRHDAPEYKIDKVNNTARHPKIDSNEKIIKLATMKGGERQCTIPLLAA